MTTTLPARVESSGALDRKAVRKFFSFRLNSDELAKPKLNTTRLFWAAVVGFVLGMALARGSMSAAIALAVFAGAVVFAFDRWQAEQSVAQRQRRRDENHDEFRRLAEETRAVQGADLLKALLRVFERTMIDRSQLKVLDARYVFSDEARLLDEEKLEQRLGDLLNKSVRLISMGDYSNKADRKILWQDTRREEFFYNPMRLVSLFLTETQLVICDVQIDSMDGDLKEDIQRIALPKIVNIRFTSERMRFPLKDNVDQIARTAEDLGYSPEEIRDIRESVTSGQSDWVKEYSTSMLAITRTDGRELSVPIRSDVYFGKHRSALDQDSALTEDEIRVDRMINELNRLVENAK